MQQLDIFNYDKQKFVFNKKKIKLFESFAGIGTQAMALKRLGVNVEHVGFSEIDKFAIKSYHLIHGSDIKNYGDITKIHGSDLPEIDIFTYSFPCQDLSKAGNKKGLFNSRSGLVYEVLRILAEMKNKPKVLLLENVPDLLSSRFIDDFEDIKDTLVELNYKNFTKIFNAKEFDIPQNRSRVFMVSILGDYNFVFPERLVAKKTLLDFLEKNVDSKYYLSQKKIESIKFDLPRANMIFSNNCFYIKQNVKAGYGVIDHGDGFYIDRPHQKRGVVQKNSIPTLKTSSKDIAVNVNGIFRNLTPLETWRLMGIDDNDFYKVSSYMSDTQLYKQSGNAIVVDVLVHIFKQLFHNSNVFV